MERNIINIDLNQYGLHSIEGISFIPLHAFNVKQMRTNVEWTISHFSQSCIVLRPSKFITNDVDNADCISMTIDANLKLNIDDFKIEILGQNNYESISQRA